MNLKPEILAILVCPACRGTIAVTADGNSLKCETCHRVYPIRDGIPSLIIDEAKIDQPENA